MLQLKRERIAEHAEELRIERNLSEKEVERYIDRKMDYQMPQVSILKFRLDNFNPVYFEMNEYWDYLSESFDYFVLKEC